MNWKNKTIVGMRDAIILENIVSQVVGMTDVEVTINQKWYATYLFIKYGWASNLTIQDNKALQRLQMKIICIINFQSF